MNVDECEVDRAVVELIATFATVAGFDDPDRNGRPACSLAKGETTGTRIVCDKHSDGPNRHPTLLSFELEKYLWAPKIASVLLLIRKRILDGLVLKVRTVARKSGA